MFKGPLIGERVERKMIMREKLERKMREKLRSFHQALSSILES